MIKDTTKSQEEYAAKNERFRLRLNLEKAREKQWINRYKNVDLNANDFEKITWEEALEGKGYIIKKAEPISNSKNCDIWKAKKKDVPEDICVKVVRFKDAPKHYLHMYSRRNLRLLTLFQHAAIVKIITIFAMQNNEKIFLFMELGEKGNLTKLLKKNGPIAETQAVMYMKDVADGIQYLHNGGIAHRNLTTDHIVITGADKAKICALQNCGEICDIAQNDEVMPCWMNHESGSFVTPEALGGEPHSMFDDDIWAFGTCLYTCICGGYPFDSGKDKEKLVAQMKELKWATKPRAKALSANSKSFLESIYQIDPLVRPVADELLKHPLFSNVK